MLNERLCNEEFENFALAVLNGVKKHMETSRNTATIVGAYEHRLPLMLKMEFYVMNGQKFYPKVTIKYEFNSDVLVRVSTRNPDKEVAKKYMGFMAGEAQKAVDMILNMSKVKKTA